MGGLTGWALDHRIAAFHPNILVSITSSCRWLKNRSQLSSSFCSFHQPRQGPGSQCLPDPRDKSETQDAPGIYQLFRRPSAATETQGIMCSDSNGKHRCFIFVYYSLSGRYSCST